METLEASGDLGAELGLLNGLLATSGPWARAALARAAADSPWFAAQARELAPPSSSRPAIALAAGMAVSLPLAGSLAAHAQDWGERAVRHVLGHQTVEGEAFDFRDGEAVWSDTGRAVTRGQLVSLDRQSRQEFYASMGLAEPHARDAEPARDLDRAETIRVWRDGREAPVLAEIRLRVATARARQQAEYLAYTVPPARDPVTPGIEAEPASGAPPADTLFGQIWRQVAAERRAAMARGEQSPAGIAAGTPSLYQTIWAEVQAERAAAKGDSIVSTLAAVPGDQASASEPPPEADAPLAPDRADALEDPTFARDAQMSDIADVPPERDLLDASAAFMEPRG